MPVSLSHQFIDVRVNLFPEDNIDVYVYILEFLIHLGLKNIYWEIVNSHCFLQVEHNAWCLIVCSEYVPCYLEKWVLKLTGYKLPQVSFIQKCSFLDPVSRNSD